MFINGREVILTIKKWNSWDKNFETKIDGEEITDHITKWMDNNTVQGRYTTKDASENLINFEQVRIPLYDDKNKALDARDFGKKLQKFLKAAPYNFEVKLMTRGLGEAILVLGEK
jgi:hypothetical protein